MRFLLLSDAHLDGPDDPVQERFVEWTVGIDADGLYLLGDIFHRWWEWRGQPFPQYVPVLQALRALSDRGVHVTVLRGNHDFAAHGLRSLARVALANSLDVSFDGRRFVLAHGDQADSGLSYRLARGLLRGKTFAGILNTMPRSSAWRFLGRIAGAAHEDSVPSPALLAAQRRFARQVLEDGPGVVVLGHSHSPAFIDLGKGTLVRLGAHDRGGCVLEVRDGEPGFRFEWDR